MRHAGHQACDPDLGADIAHNAGTVVSDDVRLDVSAPPARFNTSPPSTAIA
jgi:hypothetical protein